MFGLNNKRDEIITKAWKLAMDFHHLYREEDVLCGVSDVFGPAVHFSERGFMRTFNLSECEVERKPGERYDLEVFKMVDGVRMFCIMDTSDKEDIDTMNFIEKLKETCSNWDESFKEDTASDTTEPEA